MTDARALVERMFGILDNQRYDELTTVVTEDAVKVEPQVTTHSAAEWAENHKAWAAAVPDGRHTRRAPGRARRTAARTACRWRGSAPAARAAARSGCRGSSPRWRRRRRPARSG